MPLKTSKLFLDLDGTLIDSRLRMHSLFKALVPASLLSFDEYWLCKRQRQTHAQILKAQHGYSDEQLSDFETKWMSEIELASWLKLDSVLPDVFSSLDRLAKERDLILVTARQIHSAAIDQIKRLQLKKYFADVLITEAKLSKYQLIGSKYHSLTRRDWIIGDTPEDVRTGRLLGIRAAAVLTGFVGRGALTLEKPDLLINNLSEFY